MPIWHRKKGVNWIQWSRNQTTGASKTMMFGVEWQSCAVTDDSEKLQERVGACNESHCDFVTDRKRTLVLFAIVERIKIRI